MQRLVLLLLVVVGANAGVFYNGLVNAGIRSGPVHPAFGDLVATRRGLRPISLEGFSEDDNHDGQVDPVGQAVATPIVAAAPAPIPPVAAYSAPLIAAHAPIPTAPLVRTVATPTVLRSVVSHPIVLA